MSQLVVSVRKIDSVVPHPNADRLDLAVVGGWQTVIVKGAFESGQLIVYIPSDSIVPVELSDNYKFTQYLKDGRVRATRLRGEPSYGVIIPNEQGFAEGEEVGEKLGISKWTPPLRSVGSRGSGGLGTDEAEPHALFVRYTEIENLRHYNTVLQDGEEVVCTEKVHGCVRWDQRVLMADGTELEVCHIKPGDHVKAFNAESQQFVSAEVNSVLRQKATDKLDWYELDFDNGRKLICTADHPVFTKNRGWVRADQIDDCDDILSAEGMTV